MIERTVEEELSRLPAFEEWHDITPQDAASMRWHAAGLRARARYAEDKGQSGSFVSNRWIRVIARALEEGALAADVDHG